MKTIFTSSSLILATVIAAASVHAEDVNSPVVVNVENFARAETSAQFDRILQMTEGINQFVHLRGPTPLDKQNVIRMNRDTLYSAAVVDISKGATSDYFDKAPFKFEGTLKKLHFKYLKKK